VEIISYAMPFWDISVAIVADSQKVARTLNIIYKQKISVKILDKIYFNQLKYTFD